MTSFYAGFMGEPLPEWTTATCIVCPAQSLGPGCFDVVSTPDVRYQRDSELGYRVDTETKAPVCVHPFRVGLAPGRYASLGQHPDDRQPVPAATVADLPDRVDDLEAWFVTVVRTTDPDLLAGALDAAETTALERFGGEQVVAALRRVFAYELS